MMVAPENGSPERFQAKACPGLDPGWIPVRVKETRQNQKMERVRDFIQSNALQASDDGRPGMADDERKPHGLEDRLDAYAAWVSELRHGKSPPPPLTDAGPPLAKLSQELQLLSDAITRRENELIRLFKVVHTAERGILVEDVLDRIFEDFAGILPYDRIGCAFLSEGGTRINALWARSNLKSPQITKGYSQPMQGSSLQEVFRTGKPRILNDLVSYLAAKPTSDATRRIVAEGGRSSLTCPLFVDGHPFGVLFFTSGEKNTYRDVHQATFLQIADEVATVINKSRLFQELVDSNRFFIRQADQLNEVESPTAMR
jgi:hypothetical protein